MIIEFNINALRLFAGLTVLIGAVVCLVSVAAQFDDEIPNRKAIFGVGIATGLTVWWASIVLIAL